MTNGLLNRFVQANDDALLLRGSDCKTHSGTEGINNLHGLYLPLLLTTLFTQRPIMSRSVIVPSLFGGWGGGGGQLTRLRCFLPLSTGG